MTRKVICVTDGDEYAYHAVSMVAEQFGAYCIAKSQSNPTVMTGNELVKLILAAPREPIFVLFDDSGCVGIGPGERALSYVVRHKEIDVIGILAVASKTHNKEWTRVNVSIDRFGEFTSHGVDKEGLQEMELNRINGDTVYILDELDVPIVVGVGDIGKMGGFDEVEKGSPITRKAIEYIYERNGIQIPRNK